MQPAKKSGVAPLVLRALCVLVVVGMLASTYFLLAGNSSSTSDRRAARAQRMMRRGATLYPRSSACSKEYDKDQDLMIPPLEAEEPLPVLTTQCESRQKTELQLRQTLRQHALSQMELHRLRLQQQGLQGEVLAENRLVLRNFLTAQECSSIIDVAKRAGILEKRSHGGLENLASEFSVLNFHEMNHVRGYSLVYETATRMLNFARHQWNHTNVWIDLPQITVRNPTPGGVGHGMHADNCLVLEDGNCLMKTDRCCAWRTYTMVLFLNEPGATKGGEFEFEGSPLRVAPECGTMAAFTSNGENLHAVTPTTMGLRWALPIWFTETVDRAQTLPPPK